MSDKVSKAAAKKYKLKATDLSKADELNKANTEFQGKCSSYPPRVAATAPIEPVTTAVRTTPVETARPSRRFRRRSRWLRQWRRQETTQAANTPATGGTLGRVALIASFVLNFLAPGHVVKMWRRLDVFCTGAREGLHGQCACGEKRPGFQIDGGGHGVRQRSALVCFRRSNCGSMAVLLAGCAGNTERGGRRPWPAALSGGETCQSIRTNLNRSTSRVCLRWSSSRTPARSCGAPQKAKADLYNQLLDKYLGARCHV